MTALVDRLAGSYVTTIAALVVLSILAVAIGVAFDLTLAGAIGLYFVVWWTILFAILPVRMKTQHETGEVTTGTEPGAPADPALKHRAIWTTIVSTVVFAAISAFFPLAGL